MPISSSVASVLFSSDESSNEMWVNSSSNGSVECRSKNSESSKSTVRINARVKKWLKWISLLVLVIQASALVLVLRYSRMPAKKIVNLQKLEEVKSVTKQQPKYLSSTAVVMAELVKFFTCLLILFVNNKCSCRRFSWEIDTDIFKKGKDTLKIGIPALLYVVQNNLVFLALSKLDAATYQVTSQLKILTTVAFSMLMLDKKLTRVKWFSLVLLTVGVALVQLPADNTSPIRNENNSDKVIGILAVFVSCFSSGFACVFFEKMLKSSDVSLWIRNVQLSFFGIFGGLFMTWLYDLEAVQNQGFFQGYYWLVWVVVLLQAYGGIIIALVMKYADNILKGFAVSLSIVISCFVSWFFLADFVPTYAFIIGATVVVVSTFLYGYEPKKMDSEHSV